MLVALDERRVAIVLEDEVKAWRVVDPVTRSPPFTSSLVLGFKTPIPTSPARVTEKWVVVAVPVVDEAITKRYGALLPADA